MADITLRLYAELNDRISPEKRMKPFGLQVDSSASVAEVLDTIGIPHTEVDLVFVNGESVDLGHILHHGDMVSVYPVFESFDVGALVKIRSRPLRDPRFVLDTHLGRLAVYLRLLGFDSLYRSDYKDPELLEIARQEERVLLSRDRALLSSEDLTRGFLVRSSDPRQQVREILERFDLYSSVRPFLRCLRCNTFLIEVPKQDVMERIPAKTREYFDEFFQCPTCSRVYWKGSHYQRMRKFIESVTMSRNSRP